jgi:type IV pilus assembly protein PilM
MVEAVRWDLPIEAASEWDLPDEAAEAKRGDALAQVLKSARDGRSFHGREAVLCLGGENLHVQNLRVPKAGDDDLQRLVYKEAAGRIPFPIDQAEIRFIDAGDVRQGSGVRREVIVLAVHQPVLQRLLQTVTTAGLRPVAIDAEPLALLRCYGKQFRRDQDRHQRALFVHIGSSQSLVVIAKGLDVLFVKYIALGGRHLDQAVAQTLKLDLPDASALRRHNGDRRADQQDPEVSRSIAEAVRPVLDQLANELAMCTRYHSVTFRGEPLARLVLGGGEASPALLDSLSGALNLRGELGNPLRLFETSPPGGRPGQWDVVTGLALRAQN